MYNGDSKLEKLLISHLKSLVFMFTVIREWDENAFCYIIIFISSH